MRKIKFVKSDSFKTKSISGDCFYYHGAFTKHGFRKRYSRCGSNSHDWSITGSTVCIKSNSVGSRWHSRSGKTFR